MAIDFNSWRMLPPAAGPFTLSANGRTYTCPLGSSISVPACDASILASNGWSRVAVTGSTSARSTAFGPTVTLPGAINAGTQFYDETLGALLTFDGATWRSPTGAAV